MKLCHIIVGGQAVVVRAEDVAAALRIVGVAPEKEHELRDKHQLMELSLDGPEGILAEYW